MLQKEEVEVLRIEKLLVGSEWKKDQCEQESKCSVELYCCLD